MSQVPILNDTNNKDAQCSTAIIAILRENLAAAETKLIGQFCAEHYDYAANFASVQVWRRAVEVAEREFGRRYRI